jgi:hypothetical protein
VVHALAARLIEGVEVPEIRGLSSAEFWPAMAELLEGLGRAATRRPETWFLGEMFHRPTSDDDGQLQVLRDQVEQWLRRALVHGRKIGVIRDDLPEELLIELTLAVLQTLDRWAVRHKLHSPGGPRAPHTATQIIRDLIATR